MSAKEVNTTDVLQNVENQQLSTPSLLSSLLSMPRSGLSVGMDMVMSIPTVIGQGSEMIYSGATSAVCVTRDMIKSALPNVNPFGGESTCSNGSLSDPEDDSVGFDLEENHFSASEEHTAYKTEEDLLKAIETTKDEIMNKFDDVEERRTLVAKLIELRLQVQELKDKKDERISSIVIKEHRFESISPLKLRKGRVFCEACGGLVWVYIQSWYRCRGCGYIVHGRCTELVRRICASFTIKESRNIITRICPERGLHTQLYACFECGASLSNNHKVSEPRLCDYTGQYYCPTCHWGKKMVIPARVIHNWDFKHRKVSNASCQYLRLMDRSAVLDVEALNPKIFGLVEELDRSKAMRVSILAIKEYLVNCKSAGDLRLLSLLKDRCHFVESSTLYSLKDLKDLNSGSLILYMEGILETFRKHVEEECEFCQKKSVTCSLCLKGSPLFTFTPSAVKLKCCKSLVHKECLVKFGRCVQCIDKSDE